MSRQKPWSPPGPISALFVKCWERVVAIMGPIGSGKTTTSLLKVAYFGALLQKPQADGVRRWRAVSIRDTYRQVWRATIPTWSEWFPRSVGEFKGSDGGPASHKLVVEHPADGGPVEIEVNFLALGDNNIEEVLRGYEFSAIHFGEADLFNPDALMFANGRVGRYPREQDGGVVWPGVVLEYNAPDIENYLYRLFEEERPEGFRLFKLPSGLSPEAENIRNLRKNYYTDQIAGAADWYVRRMIENRYGFSRSGMPVYEHDYNDDLHCAREPFEPVEGIPCQLGLDSDGSPAAVLRQKLPGGQRRFIDEVAPDSAYCGVERFGRLVKDMLARYPGVRVDLARCDPSGAWGFDEKEGEVHWIAALAKILDVPIRPASTNKMQPRVEALRHPMGQLIDGGQPALLISPRCRVLRKALAANYRYRKMQVAGEDRFDPKPDKNHPWSDVVDAAQYVELDEDFDFHLMRERDRLSRPARQSQAILNSADDPELFGGGSDEGFGGGRRRGRPRGDAEL